MRVVVHRGDEGVVRRGCVVEGRVHLVYGCLSCSGYVLLTHAVRQQLHYY